MHYIILYYIGKEGQKNANNKDSPVQKNSPVEENSGGRFSGTSTNSIAKTDTLMTKAIDLPSIYIGVESADRTRCKSPQQRTTHILA